MLLAKTKINNPIDIYLIIRTAKRRTFDIFFLYKGESEKKTHQDRGKEKQRNTHDGFPHHSTNHFLSPSLIPTSTILVSSFVICPYHYELTIVAQHEWCQQ